jgi:pimeloyl-ACP methyl ester carboxylesterase
LAQLTVNGAGLVFDDRGAGEPVFVFVHGWACDRSFWAPQFDDLSRDHRCVSIDLRGCGESQAAAPYHASQAADDVISLIDALHLSGAILVGHSLGGLIALLINERRPELLNGIVLGDSPLDEKSVAGFPRTARRIREAGRMQPIADWLDSLFADATPPAVREHVRDVMLGCNPAVAAGMLKGDEHLIGRLDELIRKADRKPLMAIWGQNPGGDPAHLREIAMFVRQEPIAGAGHFFQLEQPAITNALLRAFEDDVRRDPRLEPKA